MKIIRLTLIALGIFLTISNIVRAANPVSQAEGQEYVVQAGDWLSKLADKYYGDVQAWPAIMQATNARAITDNRFAVIEDPNLIEVGQKLWIPLDDPNLELPGKRVTTVFLLRHAERGDGTPCNPDEVYFAGDEPCLSPAGKERAQQLVQVAGKARVQAIFSTQTNRTWGTVRPLAKTLNLEISPYAFNDIAELASRILSDYAGQVVLVVSHSGTVEAIVSALGGDSSSCPIGSEFDNLCLVTIAGPGTVSVINLQYGQPSPPGN